MGCCHPPLDHWIAGSGTGSGHDRRALSRLLRDRNSDLVMFFHGKKHRSHDESWQTKTTRPGKRLQFANLKMAIEIVDFPMKNGDFP